MEVLEEENILTLKFFSTSKLEKSSETTRQTSYEFFVGMKI
jgi:hypothetical protein